MTDEKVTVLSSPTHVLGIFQEMLSGAMLHFLLVDQFYDKHLEKTDLGPEDPTIFSKQVSWAAPCMVAAVTTC